MSASPSIRRIERLNYVIGGVAVVIAALTQPRAMALGVAVGVALTCANFFVLRKLVVKWTADAAAGKGGSTSAMLMMPKMILLMGAVVAALALLPINAIAFTIGYSIFIISILFETVHATLRSETDNG